MAIAIAVAIAIALPRKRENLPTILSEEAELLALLSDPIAALVQEPVVEPA